jgi:ferredoxin-NADP reductase
MQVTLVKTHQEAANITTFFFKPEKPLYYTAGQFIELTLPHDDPDERGIKRWFTLSSSPSEEYLSITTKFVTNGSGSSFKKALRTLDPGDTLNMSDPMGDFVLPKYIQTPLIFVAGGIGITPFHSMLSWLADTNEERDIKLLYGVNSEEDIVFQQTFERAKQHATIIVNEPSAAWGGERGIITAEKILGLEQPRDDTLIYVSGPEPMVQGLERDLKAAGIPGRQLVLDFFENYVNV